MATTVNIDGYLVQAKLDAALRQVVGEAAWRGSEQRVIHGKKLRWDMVFEALQAGRSLSSSMVMSTTVIR